MGFMEAVKSVVLKRYADFQGRSPRSEYWWFTLFMFLLQVVGMLLSGILGSIIPILGLIVSILLLVVYLGLIIPAIAVAIRRMHDLDKSGWFILLSLIPLVGLIVLYWFCCKGTDGDNRFGPDPLGNVSDRFS